MREKGHKRYDRVRKILLFWTLFIGLGALYGSLSMFIRPDGSLLGMENLLPYFSVLPFSSILYQDYIFPGIALLLVNGVPNLIASYLLIRKREAEWYWEEFRALSLCSGSLSSSSYSLPIS